MASFTSTTAASGLTVVDEIWENQRYKLMGWSRPLAMDGGFQSFSDRLGTTVYSKGAFPNLLAPAGWDWAAAEWKLDVDWADVDEEGWCYGASFAALREQLLVHGVSPQKNATDFVRRRRWIRMRGCVAPEAREAWDGYVDFLQERVAAEQRQLRRREEAFEGMRSFEERRRAAVATVFRRADHELLAQGGKLADTFDSLLSLKVLLQRRADIDRSHAALLHRYLTTFSSEEAAAESGSSADAVKSGDLTTAQGMEAVKGGLSKPIASVTSVLTTPLFSITDEVTERAVELHQGFSAPDHAQAVGSKATFDALWNRMGGAAVLAPQWRAIRVVKAYLRDGLSLVGRADQLVNEVAEAMQSCADLRRLLRKLLNDREDDCGAAFRSYNQVYDALSLDGAKRLQRLRSVAADPAPYGASPAEIDGFKGPEKADLWLVENTYRAAAHKSTSACLALSKSLPRTLLRVAELAGAGDFLVEAAGRQFNQRQQRMYQEMLQGSGDVQGSSDVQNEKTVALPSSTAASEADAGEAGEDSVLSKEGVDESSTAEPLSVPTPEQKTRMETLMQEAHDHAAAFSAEQIEALLPELAQSGLVMRVAMANRITLGPVDGVFAKARSLAKEAAAGMEASPPPGAVDAEGAQSASAAPPATDEKAPSSDATTADLRKQSNLVILSLDGFLHLFEASGEQVDPGRLAAKGPALTLDVRPRVRGVEAVVSDLAPDALRIRGALQRSLMRLSAGGLFDVVLAEWGPDLAAPVREEAAQDGGEGKRGMDGRAEQWKGWVLHPLGAFGLDKDMPPRPQGPRVEEMASPNKPSTPRGDFLRSLVPQLRVEEEDSEEDGGEIHVTFADADGGFVDEGKRAAAEQEGSTAHADTIEEGEEEESAFAALQAAGFGANSKLAEMLGGSEASSANSSPKKTTPRRRLTPTGSAGKDAMSAIAAVLEEEEAENGAMSEVQGESASDEPTVEGDAVEVETVVKADAEAEAEAETGGYEDDAEPRMELGAGEATVGDKA